MSGSEIWVYLEREGAQFEEVSLEMLGAARRLADKFNNKVTGVILGHDPSDLGESAVKYGADSALFLKHDKLDSYGTEVFTSAMAELMLQRKPDILLVGATRSGRDLAARLAARLRTGLSANVVTLDIDEKGVLYSGVPGYGSKVIANIVCVKNKPQMSTVRAGVFEKNAYDPERKGSVEILKPNLDGVSNAVTVMSRITQEAKDISSSERVVIMGNGASSQPQIFEKFAEVLEADIGVTRPIADRGIYPRDLQVGSTGVSLKAKHVLVVGSSGSEHFVTGVANCKNVISIDIDPKSDMFDHSDYCVVGDASKILQEIIRKMEVLLR